MLTRIALALALLPVLLVRADFDAGLRAYDRGDYATALKEWSETAKKGDPKAQFSVGVMYAKGEGIPQNFGEALKWYRLAADQGHSDAQLNLGVMYAKGEGVAQNYTLAAKWFRLAADQGHPGAQVKLGILYEGGKGVPQDNVLAHMWYNLAGAQGDKDAAGWRDKLAARMLPDEIGKAQELAKNWKPKASGKQTESRAK